MSLKKSVHKRKIKKAYGYFFLSTGLFCLVLFVCLSISWLHGRSARFLSPLGTLQAFVASKDTVEVVQQVNDLCVKNSLSCQDITLISQDDIAFTINTHQVLISRTKSISQEIASLQLIIRQLTMEGKEFHRLDFRYDRPVISY